MSHQVTLRASSRAFFVRDGETVLEGALREGIVVAYGCRSGSCGACKGRLVSGSIDQGIYEEHALPAVERESGLALLCRARPLTDLVIDCREIAGVGEIPIKSLPCRVLSLVRLAPDVMQMRLKLPSNERLQYLPGQYVDLMLRDGTRRSFSMATPPHDDATLELHLRNYGGAFSGQVFGGMKEKDILRLEGPFGTFFLRKGGVKPIVFVASGTGFAPIKAIIEYALQTGITRHMTLYWGCRVRVDLYSNDLAERWQTEHGVRYVPVLSEALPSDQWTGRTGLVHRAVMEDLPDLSEHQIYACGAPAMVEAAQRDFTALCGLSQDEFFSDSFTPSATAKA